MSLTEEQIVRYKKDLYKALFFPDIRERMKQNILNLEKELLNSDG